MKHFRLPIALCFTVLGLSFAGAASAQSAPSAGAGGAPAPATLRWSEIEQPSALLGQAKAAAASLRALIAIERGVEIETVSVVAANVPGPRLEETRGYCQHLPRPGSRFMEERCFYPDAGERAINNYQFQAEIDQIRYQQDLLFIEHATYSEAYRRSLKE